MLCGFPLETCHATQRLLSSLDIGTDPAKIRDWGPAAEDLGYAYIEVPDHVFGAKGRDGWVPLYNEKDPFHEIFVTLGFLAAVTKTIRLSTGILIAPQRQTGLIAKQAAEVDVLSPHHERPRPHRELTTVQGGCERIGSCCRPLSIHA
jgi:alkanesulfonate monooxygenase SsuD/methylene tetrahydromethanopterin reductase-like flavin-dependent oxidoreductase (luciferase family)